MPLGRAQALKGAQDFRSFVRLAAEQIHLAQQIERMGIARFEFKGASEYLGGLRVLALLHIDLAQFPQDVGASAV